jgi:cytochrome b6-f complex subunit 7
MKQGKKTKSKGKPLESLLINHSQRRITLMSGEILNAALLSFGLIFVGWALGALLLKIQGAEE